MMNFWFWNHSKQHSSKTHNYKKNPQNAVFATIRNKTPRKRRTNLRTHSTFWNHSKQHSSKTRERRQHIFWLFWNHSKQHSSKTKFRYPPNEAQFWNHSKQHSSKTAKSYEEMERKVLEPFETTQL